MTLFFYKEKFRQCSRKRSVWVETKNVGLTINCILITTFVHFVHFLHNITEFLHYIWMYEKFSKNNVYRLFFLCCLCFLRKNTYSFLKLHHLVKFRFSFFQTRRFSRHDWTHTAMLYSYRLEQYFTQSIFRYARNIPTLNIVLIIWLFQSITYPSNNNHVLYFARFLFAIPNRVLYPINTIFVFKLERTAFERTFPIVN